MKNNREKRGSSTWWIVFGTMALTLLLFTLSCKKTKQSDSAYRVAYMSLGKVKYIYRNGTGKDSVKEDFAADAYFGDGSDPNLLTWHIRVGGVWLGPIKLDDPGVSGHTAPYSYHETNFSDASASRLDNAIWKVISPNGITDISFNTGSTAYYKDTMPYAIDRSQGFSIRIDSSEIKNADSVYISLIWANTNKIDTMVGANAGTLFFSPARLSGYSRDSTWTHHLVIEAIKTNILTVEGKTYTINLVRTLDYAINIY